jgi:hypothetical protein
MEPVITKQGLSIIQKRGVSHAPFSDSGPVREVRARRLPSLAVSLLVARFRGHPPFPFFFQRERVTCHDGQSTFFLCLAGACLLTQALFLTSIII